MLTLVRGEGPAPYDCYAGSVILYLRMKSVFTVFEWLTVGEKWRSIWNRVERHSDRGMTSRGRSNIILNVFAVALISVKKYIGRYTF